MRKSKFILVLLALAFTLSVGLFSACNGTTPTNLPSIRSVSISEYEFIEQKGSMGFVFVGDTDVIETVYGAEVKDTSGQKTYFEGEEKDGNGLFNVYITGLIHGDYSIRAYAGENSRRVFGREISFNIPKQEVESIKIKPSGIMLYEGGNPYALTVEITPSTIVGEVIEWSSQDEDIATVDQNGVVYGISMGTTTVVATTSNGKTSTCTIQVKNQISVQLDKSSHTIFKGEIFSLHATTSAPSPITWSSSNESVATVDNNGNVQGIADGTVFIRATSSSGHSASCEVIVAGDFSVSLDITSKTVKLHDEFTLTPIVTPSVALNRGVTWSTSDPSIATVDEGQVKAVGKGSAYITATVGGKSASCEVIVADDVKVTFVLDGEDYTVRYTGSGRGYKIDIPLDPVDRTTDLTKAFYFEGWYTNSACTIKLTENTEFTINSTVYAKISSIFTYEVLSNKIMITGLADRDKNIENLTIPAQINGKTVDSVGYSAFRGSNLITVHFENGITTVYDDAFRDCLGLDTVTFAKNSTLKIIGDSVFRDCVALTSITLPKGIEQVGELCFYGVKFASYDQLYQKNVTAKKYYAPKFTYEFMGEDTLPIGGYIEPSVGYFAPGVTLEQVMHDYVDSGCNILICIGQARYGTSYNDYINMVKYLEKYGGMIMPGNASIFPFGAAVGLNSPAVAGAHVIDEPGFSDWVEGEGEYSRYEIDQFGKPMYTNPNKVGAHLSWTKAYARKLYFINLLPINSPTTAFSFGADNYNVQENLTLLYPNHVANNMNNVDYYYRTYIECMHPEVFSYDFYPMWANGEGNAANIPYPQINGRHFEQLYKTRYYTQEYSLSYHGHETPFWNFIQLAGWGNQYSGARSVTLGETLWQVNTAFIFGSKGYQYFVFNDYGDISGAGNPSGYIDTPIKIDGTKNVEVYNKVLDVNTQSQAFAKWILNASVDHIYQYGKNPNGETIHSSMFETRDNSINWALRDTSGKNNLVSYMKYYANNNEYVEGVAGDVRQLYFVCNNGTLATNNGDITLNFNKSVSGSYIYDGVEKRFSGTSLTVKTEAGEGFAVLLDK